TLEAERAFQGMNQCIAELLMVTAPRPREELIMYLCAAREAVSTCHKKTDTVLPGISDSSDYGPTHQTDPITVQKH
ncbi:hypothetical protein Tco_0284642, partial [Tanacetum coccineum]